MKAGPPIKRTTPIEAGPAKPGQHETLCPARGLHVVLCTGSGKHQRLADAQDESAVGRPRFVPAKRGGHIAKDGLYLNLTSPAPTRV